MTLRLHLDEEGERPSVWQDGNRIFVVGKDMWSECFTIDELMALTRLLEHEFTTYDDEGIIKVLDKIFNAVNEYKRNNGMVG